ncbi:MAG TPA: hypothetical protein ENG70_01370 [Candidatus Cloacimonetes bacterium]|nr:hypothetical protein [Candidatus Cloacimonadota bacterium]HEX37499.1 hypothetical protein [Candidatus Cloacimonadota bacterium]
MKNTLLFVLIIMYVPILIFSDIAPSDHHIVQNCVRFTNLDDYPEIAILGFIVGPTYDSPHFFEIKNEKCLDKGYKFNDLGLYWAQKKYIDSVGIENIVINTSIRPELYGDAYFKQVTNDPNIHFITSSIDAGDFWVDEFDPLQSQISDYEIAGFIGDEIVLFLRQQIKKNSSGEEENIMYDFPEIPNLKWSPFSSDSEGSSESSQKQ